MKILKGKLHFVTTLSLCNIVDHIMDVYERECQSRGGKVYELDVI